MELHNENGFDQSTGVVGANAGLEIEASGDREQGSLLPDVCRGDTQAPVFAKRKSFIVD